MNLRKDNHITLSCKRGFEEYIWIDYVLNRYSNLVYHDLTAHLLQCAGCKRLHDEWKHHLLAMNKEPLLSQETNLIKGFKLVVYKLKRYMMKLSLYHALLINYCKMLFQRITKQKRWISALSLYSLTVMTASLLLLPTNSYTVKQQSTAVSTPTKHAIYISTEHAGLKSVHDSREAIPSLMLCYVDYPKLDHIQLDEQYLTVASYYRLLHEDLIIGCLSSLD